MTLMELVLILSFIFILGIPVMMLQKHIQYVDGNKYKDRG